MWDFLNETIGEKPHEGQITFHVASAAEPPGEKVSEMKSVPVHLTFHDRTDMAVLSDERTAGLRRHRILRMTHEALEQGGLLTQEDLAVLLCSSRRTIRRDIKDLKNQGIDVLTRGTLQDIGPGITHTSKVVKLWLEGIPAFGKEELRRSRNSTSTPISSAVPVIPAFQSRDIYPASGRQFDLERVDILNLRYAN